MLKTIAALGPEKALRHTDYYRHGYDIARNKHILGKRNILDLAGIAKAMRVKKAEGEEPFERYPANPARYVQP